jgi:hypothetical protein
VSTLFKRQVILQLGTESNKGKSFSDLRVDFRIDHSRTGTPNTGVIVAYNLNEESVALMQQPGAVVRVLAGYDVPHQIFRGSPVRNGVTLTKQGPDRLLKIEAEDGGRQLAQARLNVSFDTQVTIQEVFDAVAAQLGLPTGTIRLADTSITYPNGIHLAGPARDILDRLALSTGSDVFTRDGILHAIPTDGDTGETAVVFSAELGNLVGSPTPKDDGVEVTALLEPSMRPGRAFRLKSRRYNGDYVARDVSFVGSSGWDQAFYVVVTGRERG